MNFEHKPLDGRADNAITMKMLPLKVVVNPAILNMIFGFFKPQADDELDSLSSLKAAATAQLQGVTAQTRAGLIFAIEEHSTLDLNVEVDAPIFVFPSNIHIQDSSLIVIDAGHLKVQSELVDKRSQPEVRELATKSMMELAADIYDKFSIDLTSSKVLIIHHRSVWQRLQPMTAFFKMRNQFLKILMFRCHLKCAFYQMLLNTPSSSCLPTCPDYI